MLCESVPCVRIRTLPHGSVFLMGRRVKVPSETAQRAAKVPTLIAGRLFLLANEAFLAFRVG